MSSNFLKLSYLEDERSYSGALSDLACGWAGCDLGQEACVPGLLLSTSHLLLWKMKGRDELPQLACHLIIFWEWMQWQGGGAEHHLRPLPPWFLVPLPSLGLSVGISLASQNLAEQVAYWFGAVSEACWWHSHLRRVAVLERECCSPERSSLALPLENLIHRWGWAPGICILTSLRWFLVPGMLGRHWFIAQGFVQSHALVFFSSAVFFPFLPSWLLERWLMSLGSYHFSASCLPEGSAGWN